MTEIIFLDSVCPKEYPMYIVCEDGSVYSRYMKQFLKLSLNKDGYTFVSLYKNGAARRKLLHRLIAECFIPNPDKKPIVNHKDLDKANNVVSNLEWTTSKENARHAMKNGANPCRSQPVHQFSSEGKFIASYKTIKKASIATGLSQACISYALHGKSLMSGGFYWMKENKFVKPYSRLCKPVEQLCPKTGKVLATFPSAGAAEEALGKKGHIGSVCTGHRKVACGYSWRFAKTEENIIEEWKDWAVLSDFPSYKISRDGRIYSDYFKRILDIKPRSGYLKTALSNKDGKRVYVSVHRLVAQAYIPNLTNLPVVNHIDENPMNNKVENLEWTTMQGNARHSAHKNTKTNKKSGHKLSVDKPNQRKVGKYDLQGNFLDEYKSIALAARSIGLTSPGGISVCLREGKQKTAGGFIWKYLD